MGLDRSLLLLINRDGSSPVLDFLMPLVSSPEHYPAVLIPAGLAAVALLAWLLLRDGTRGRLTVVALVLAVGAADLTAAQILKPSVGRLRPCRPEAGVDGVIVRGSCRGRNGFPSNHAANTAAAAAVLGVRFRRRWWIGAAVAAVVGYSRVYLGVHYPGDVLAGWTLGALFGLVAAWGVAAGWARRGGQRGD